MSIYIAGMDMPKQGDKFVVERDSEGNVYLCQENDNLDYFHILTVPVHGRLFDVDKLIKRLDRQARLHEEQAKRAEEKGSGYTNDMYIVDRNRDLISMLRAQSEVIQADKEEE